MRTKYLSPRVGRWVARRKLRKCRVLEGCAHWVSLWIGGQGSVGLSVLWAGIEVTVCGVKRGPSLAVRGQEGSG